MNGQVRVTFNRNDFNKISELTSNYLNRCSEEKQKETQKFLDKILSYSSIKEDMVTIYLYPSEARFLIYLLNRNIDDIELSEDWMQKLIDNKEEYKRKKAGDLNA